MKARKFLKQMAFHTLKVLIQSTYLFRFFYILACVYKVTPNKTAGYTFTCTVTK